MSTASVRIRGAIARRAATTDKEGHRGIDRLVDGFETAG